MQRKNRRVQSITSKTGVATGQMVANTKTAQIHVHV